MPGRTKLCYKKKSTKSNGSMQFISSRRNAHQKNRRTYSKFWMRMKREKSRNKSNYQHLQNVWNKTNTQLQQSQQENQELLAEQTLHEIERVSECDTDGDIDLYQAPYKLTEIDLIKIFELLQHCSYRALPRIIEICRMLSDDFVLPSNGWINKQKQVKQEMYNHAIIAYQTTMGTFKCDDLTMGTDGSGIDGHILLLQTICITLSILGSGWVYDYANPDLVLTQMIMLMEWKHSTNFAQLLKVGMNEMLFIEQYIMETYDTKTLCILSMMSGNEIGKSVKYMIKGGRGKFDHLISNKSALLQADNVVSSNDHTEGDNRGPKHIKQKKMRILTKNAMAEAVWSRNDTGRNLMDIKSENNTLFRTIVNRANEGSASGRYRALKNKRDEQLQALHEYEEQKLSQMKKDKQKRIQRKAQATESVELFENADAFIQKVQ
eukprot:755044_1